jgi:SAM-dependent methyltransferase
MKKAWLVLLFLATPALAQDVPELLMEADIKGGLIVHVGCGDGTLCAALGEDPNYVVQGLHRDPLAVAKARSTVRAKGNYGRVSIRHWEGESLPYADNLVNLIVVSSDESRVSPAEIARVLAPRGVAFVPKGMAVNSLEQQPSSSGLDKYVKPVPDAIDDWPHYFCGADNNAVSRDTVVGPPKHMQWVCGPAYARSHEVNSSMAGMVSSGGRIFYIWDEGVLGQPEKRMLSTACCYGNSRCRIGAGESGMTLHAGTIRTTGGASCGACQRRRSDAW